jgi:threonine synthase
MTSYSISDEETKKTISEVYTKYQYLTDPHGAVGYKALADYLAEQDAAHPTASSNRKGIFLETAHPVKFYDSVEPVIGQPIPLPQVIVDIIGKEKQSKKIPAQYSQLKEYLLS